MKILNKHQSHAQDIAELLTKLRKLRFNLQIYLIDRVYEFQKHTKSAKDKLIPHVSGNLRTKDDNSDSLNDKRSRAKDRLIKRVTEDYSTQADILVFRLRWKKRLKK